MRWPWLVSRLLGLFILIATQRPKNALQARSPLPARQDPEIQHKKRQLEWSKRNKLRRLRRLDSGPDSDASRRPRAALSHEVIGLERERSALGRRGSRTAQAAQAAQTISTNIGDGPHRPLLLAEWWQAVEDAVRAVSDDPTTRDMRQFLDDEVRWVREQPEPGRGAHEGRQRGTAGSSRGSRRTHSGPECEHQQEHQREHTPPSQVLSQAESERGVRSNAMQPGQGDRRSLKMLQIAQNQMESAPESISPGTPNRHSQRINSPNESEGGRGADGTAKESNESPNRTPGGERKSVSPKVSAAQGPRSSQLQSLAGPGSDHGGLQGEQPSSSGDHLARWHKDGSGTRYAPDSPRHSLGVGRAGSAETPTKFERLMPKFMPESMR